MTIELSNAIYLIWIGQFGVLFASALVPVRLEWKQSLASLPPLMQQLFWVYGGYVVLSIISLGLVCVLNASEMAQSGPLARAICVYGMVFWGIRLALQPILAAKPFLTTWWLYGGYHLLTVLFLSFAMVYIWAFMHHSRI